MDRFGAGQDTFRSAAVCYALKCLPADGLRYYRRRHFLPLRGHSASSYSLASFPASTPADFAWRFSPCRSCAFARGDVVPHVYYRLSTGMGRGFHI